MKIKFLLSAFLVIVFVFSSFSFASGESIRFKVKGMSCGGCSKVIESKLRKAYPEAVEKVEISLETGLASIQFKSKKGMPSFQELQALISSDGHYELVPLQ